MFTVDVHVSDDVDLEPNDTKSGVLITPTNHRGTYQAVRVNLFFGGNPEEVRANGRYMIEAIERVIEQQE